MLNPSELKMVVTTLSKRRAWLRKSLENGGTEKEVRTENMEALKILDSAIQKLASSSRTSTIPSKAAPPEQTATPASVASLTGKEPAKVTKPKSFAEARILIAEDDKDSAQLLVDLVIDMGIKQIEVAKDGMEAFDKIKRAKNPFHVILCDWDMPELTGIDVHNKAKASNTLGGANFIMVTAVTDAQRIKQAVQQGISDYVVKPIDIGTLEAKILAALGLENLPNTRS